MLYKLKIWATGKHPEIDIKRKDFEKIKKNVEVLNSALAIEEKYELIISNFLELEKEILTISAEMMVRNKLNYPELFDMRSLFNRRIVNLLTSTRLYIDQIKQHIRVCDSKLTDEVERLFNHEYDSLFEYRFMEALRNYVQHRGLAVHITSYPFKRIQHLDISLMQFGTEIYATKSELERDKSFKKVVIQEMDEKVELLSASKIYISAISRVHMHIRDSISTLVNESRYNIESHINSFSKINNGESTGLMAVSYEKNDRLDKIHDKVRLFLDWDNVRIGLVEKNHKLTDFEKRYVSGKCL